MSMPTTNDKRTVMRQLPMTNAERTFLSQFGLA
jgi:hypothetical protein